MYSGKFTLDIYMYLVLHQGSLNIDSPFLCTCVLIFIVLLKFSDGP